MRAVFTYDDSQVASEMKSADSKPDSRNYQTGGAWVIRYSDEKLIESPTPIAIPKPSWMPDRHSFPYNRKRHSRL